MNFEIQFNDLTMLKANGRYDDVFEIMKEPSSNGIVKDIVVDNWMIDSTITLQNPFGFAQFSCHFYWDKRLFIAEYVPTIRDIHNPDIRCLSYWAQEYGWKRPEPLPSIIDAWEPFWHLQWDTFIIDSEHFDSQFGERDQQRFSENEEDSEGNKDKRSTNV